MNAMAKVVSEVLSDNSKVFNVEVEGAGAEPAVVFGAVGEKEAGELAYAINQYGIFMHQKGSAA